MEESPVPLLVGDQRGALHERLGLRRPQRHDVDAAETDETQGEERIVSVQGLFGDDNRPLQERLGHGGLHDAHPVGADHDQADGHQRIVGTQIGRHDRFGASGQRLGLAQSLLLQADQGQQRARHRQPRVVLAESLGRRQGGLEGGRGVSGSLFLERGPGGIHVPLPHHDVGDRLGRRERRRRGAASEHRDRQKDCPRHV